MHADLLGLLLSFNLPAGQYVCTAAGIATGGASNSHYVLRQMACDLAGADSIGNNSAAGGAALPPAATAFFPPQLTAALAVLLRSEMKAVGQVGGWVG